MAENALQKLIQKIRDMIDELGGNIKAFFEKCEEERMAKKYGLIATKLADGLKDVVEPVLESNQDNTEKLQQVYSIVSELNDHVQSFTSQDIDKFSEEVRQKTDELVSIAGKGLWITKDSIQEALEMKHISPEEQQNFSTYITKEHKVMISGKMSDGQEKSFLFEHIGNSYMLQEIDDEKMAQIMSEKPEIVSGGKTAEENIMTALTKAANRVNLEIAGMSDKIHYAEILAEVSKRKDVADEKSGIKMRFDEQQQTFFIQDENNQKMISCKIENGTASVYYYDSASYFVSNREGILLAEINMEDKGGNRVGITARKPDWSKSLNKKESEYAKSLIGSEFSRAVLNCFGGDIADDLINDSVGKPNRSKMSEEGRKKVAYLENTLKTLIQDTDYTIISAKSSVGMTLAIHAGKKGNEVYNINFTKEGDLAGYSYKNGTENVAIMTRSGAILDEKLAKSESFTKISGIVNTAVERVNMRSNDGRTLFAPEYKFEKLPVTVAEKRQPILYTEEQLRKQLGDKEFEQALKTATQIVDAVENPKASPDGMEDGFYKEMRGMPKEEQKMLSRYIGTALRRNTESLQMNDQQLRAVAFIACQNKSPEEQIKNYESFSTGFMEAVHKAREQKTPEEVGTMLMAEIIIEQNILNEREVFSAEKVETSFVPEEEMTNSVQEQKQEQDYSQHDNPEVQEDIFMQTYDRFAQTIWQNRGKDLPVEVFITEENRAIMDYAVKQELVIKDNDIYHFANVDREILESIANDFAIERVFSVDEDMAEEIANREEEHDFRSYKQKEVER